MTMHPIAPPVHLRLLDIRLAIVDIHGNDDGHTKQYIDLINENG
jgi:hypothetical protein